MYSKFFCKVNRVLFSRLCPYTKLLAHWKYTDPLYKTKKKTGQKFRSERTGSSGCKLLQTHPGWVEGKVSKHVSTRGPFLVVGVDVFTRVYKWSGLVRLTLIERVSVDVTLTIWSLTRPRTTPGRTNSSPS